MGPAWLVAVAALVLVALWPSRRALAALPALLFVPLALCASPAPPDRLRVALEGWAVAYRESDIVSDGTPELQLVAPGAATPAGTVPSLELRGVDAASVPVTVAAGRASATGPAGFEVRVDVPFGQPAMVALGGEDDLARYSNIFRLRGGESLLLCRDGQGCVSRTLNVTMGSDGLRIDSCKLTARSRPRAYALVDLYAHDPQTCVPTRGEGGGPGGLWPRSDGEGSWTVPMRSFVVVRGSDAYLALLDPPEVVEPIALGAAEDTLSWDGDEPVTLTSLVTSVRVLDEDAPNAPCGAPAKGSAGSPSGNSPSPRAVEPCRRVFVWYDVERLELQAAAKHLLVRSLPTPIITIDPVCKADGRCGLDEIQAVYAVESDPVATDAPALQFDRQLHGGEPESLLLQPTEDCEGLVAPCIRATGRAGTQLYPADRTMGIGSPDGDAHYLRATLVRWPWWLGAVLASLLVAQALSRGYADLPTHTLVAISGASVLLVARALFGFRVSVLYPHDPEALSTAVVGMATVPLALAAGTRAAAGLGVLAWGVAVVLVLEHTGAVSFEERQTWLSLVLGVGLSAGPIVAALAGRRPWLPSEVWRRAARWASDRAGPHAAIGAATALVVVLAGARLVLAYVGRERLLGVLVVAWYWPLAALAIGLLVAATHRIARPALRVLALLTAAGALVAAQALFKGDKGASIILLAPILLGILAVAPLPPTRWRVLAPLVLAVLALVGMRAYRTSLDADLPDVGQTSEWTVPEGSREDWCCPSERRSHQAPIELDRYADVFAGSDPDLNARLRWHEFVLPGAAQRSGTREGANVTEFYAVLQRYAIGRDGAWLGDGLLTGVIRQYARGEVDAALNDGVVSVLVGAEGGTVAIFSLLGLHLIVAFAFVRAAEQLPSTGLGKAGQCAAVVAATIPAWTTLVMVAGNLGLLPFTGQSTPLLTVTSAADLFIAPMLWMLAAVFLRGGQT